MKILITGASGFIGRNLVEQLKNIRDGKARNYEMSCDIVLYEYEHSQDLDKLEGYCRDCDFVFHLAGVNRPKWVEEFHEGNVTYFKRMLTLLKKHNNVCPVMLASSIQIQLDNPYSQSKLAAERLLLEHTAETGAKALVYRFPNVFGKWCRPNYNSVVATFCHNIANGLEIKVHDPDENLILVYIDDVVDELIAALQGLEHGDGVFCTVPTTAQIRLGELADKIRSFSHKDNILALPDVSDPLNRKLFATYLTYLPIETLSQSLNTHSDVRGSFTELIRLADSGQVSINITKPGAEKGNHWHNTKCEKFFIVSGQGLIRIRRLEEEKFHDFLVNDGTQMVFTIPPGYTHSFVNTGSSDLIVVIWCSECFDLNRPDTYFSEVVAND